LFGNNFLYEPWLQLNNAKGFMEADEDENEDGSELARRAELLLLLLADFVMLN
jgi:hypothetical protein